MQRWGEEDVKTADYQMLILCQGRGWLNMKIVIIVHNKAHTNDNDNRYKSMHWTRETFSNFSLPILIAVARSDCLLPILFHCSQHSLNPPIGIIAMEKDTKFPRRLWLTAAFLPIVLFRLRSAFSQLSFALRNCHLKAFHNCHNCLPAVLSDNCLLGLIRSDSA